MKVNSIGLYALDHYSLYSIAKDVIRETSEYDVASFGASNTFSELQGAFGNFDAVLERLRKHPLTSQLLAIDDLRDRCTRSTLAYIRAQQLRTNPDIVAAANTIDEIFNRYGRDITNLSRQRQSAALANILSDIDEKTDEVNLLQLTPYLDELSSAEDDYIDLMTEKAAMPEDDGLTLTNTKEPLIKSLGKFLTFIEILSEEIGDPIPELIKKINVYIDHMNASLRSPQEEPQNEEITQ